MSVLRGATTALEVFEQRVESSSPLRGHETMCRIMLTEAYVLGFLAGLEQAAHTVRVEIEATRGQLDD